MKTLAASELSDLFSRTLGSSWPAWPCFFCFALLPGDKDTFMLLKVLENLPEQSKKHILYKLLNVFQIF